MSEQNVAGPPPIGGRRAARPVPKFLGIGETVQTVVAQNYSSAARPRPIPGRAPVRLKRHSQRRIRSVHPGAATTSNGRFSVNLHIPPDITISQIKMADRN